VTRRAWLTVTVETDQADDSGLLRLEPDEPQPRRRGKRPQMPQDERK
jgi:hypothetical protein